MPPRAQHYIQTFIPTEEDSSAPGRMDEVARQADKRTDQKTPETVNSKLRYIQYDSDKETTYLPAIRRMISKDLSEPYSIYVYRYFLYQWGDLCFMALDGNNTLIGVVVSKLEHHRGGPLRGYIAMLAVKEEYRGQGIATKLVRMAIDAMIQRNADEIALETEVTNTAAMKLYERLGFLRSKRLHRYYLNGNTAFRFLLYIKEEAVTAALGYDDQYEHSDQQSPPPASTRVS
ncbi:N-alpha-acetyltransferase mak3 [Lambiella insularis]|nr:N-alpha-acetyltransferase mak3 [Lambiella insularis]